MRTIDRGMRTGAAALAVSCSLHNYDPTTYDVPGQYGYLRLSFGL